MEAWEQSCLLRLGLRDFVRATLTKSHNFHAGIGGHLRETALKVTESSLSKAMARNTRLNTEDLLELLFLSPEDQDRIFSLARQAAFPQRGRPSAQPSSLSQWLLPLPCGLVGDT
jgi:hypothetical protein